MKLSHTIFYNNNLNLPWSAYFVLFVCACLCMGCLEPENKSNAPRGEYIYRLHNEYLFVPPEPMQKKRAEYSWEEGIVNNFPKITKEFFRCKGTHLNLDRMVEKGGETMKISDCGGIDSHGLPLRDNKEFIYPILVKLLNHIQAKMGKRVVITSGHRCPEHNAYVDESVSNSYSKHMIGAEVSFYVEGLENQPERVLECLLDYYRSNPVYRGQPDFIEIKRYEKRDCNVSIPPWYNKEVFIKLFNSNEGRNLDNRHLYPYFSIQVRYDVDRQERVAYSWEQAHRNFWRK